MFRIEVFEEGRLIANDKKQTFAATKELVVMALNTPGRSANIRKGHRLVVHLWFDGEIQTFKHRK